MSLPLPSITRIMIASADAETAASLDEALRGWRYSVQVVANGMEALKVLSGLTPPEIALIDAGLPMLSGLELAAEVKRRAKKKTSWMMLLGGQVDAATVASASDAGIDDVLLKPVDPSDLRIRLGVAERVQALMSQLDAQTHAARFHASHDNLTGLWNRESLLGLLFPETDRVQRMRTPLTVLLLDLDHFSSINLDYGYESGDKILQELANRFRRYLRSYDLIGRYGEDEFLIALPGCTSEQALELSVRVKKTILQKPFAVGRDMLTLTASMGIAQSRGRSPLVVLREAERALAEAKLTGRNCVLEYVKADSGVQDSGSAPLLEVGNRKSTIPLTSIPFPKDN
jgi:two-component system, cell cycle response regulator